MPPEWANLVLTTDIPDIELDILVGDSLNVEADGGNRGDVLAELELVENGCLTSGVETDLEGYSGHYARTRRRAGRLN